MKKTEYNWTHSGEDNSFNYLIKSLKKIIIENIKYKENFLDVGCGNGFLTKNISINFKNVKAIDSSRSAIKYAKKNYNGKINFINTDIENFKTKKKFNVISLIEVIEHLYSPDNAIKNLKKLMSKNTILIISTPYHGYLKNLLITFFNKFDNHFDPLWEHGHIKFWSIKSLNKLVERNGLTVKKIYFSGRFFPLSKSMIFIIKKL